MRGGEDDRWRVGERDREEGGKWRRGEMRNDNVERVEGGVVGGVGVIGRDWEGEEWGK